MLRYVSILARARSVLFFVYVFIFLPSFGSLDLSSFFDSLPFFFFHFHFFLFERSEFLIDTSQKKSLRVCTRARVHACSTNLGFSSAVSRVDYAMTERRTRQKKQ